MSLHRFFKDVHTNGATPVTTANTSTCYRTRNAVLGSGTVDATDIKISALQSAKRQDIFFRKLEREGHKIHWLKAGRDPDPCALIEAFLNGEPLPEPAFRLCDIDYGKK